MEVEVMLNQLTDSEGVTDVLAIVGTNDGGVISFLHGSSNEILTNLVCTMGKNKDVREIVLMASNVYLQTKAMQKLEG